MFVRSAHDDVYYLPFLHRSYSKTLQYGHRMCSGSGVVRTGLLVQTRQSCPGAANFPREMQVCISVDHRLEMAIMRPDGYHLKRIFKLFMYICLNTDHIPIQTSISTGEFIKQQNFKIPIPNLKLKKKERILLYNLSFISHDRAK